MPNNTFKIKPIHHLLRRYIPSKQGKVIVDPFSDGEREFATVTNDLNPKTDADYHMDAIRFLRKLPSDYADIVLYDPPYSKKKKH